MCGRYGIDVDPDAIAGEFYVRQPFGGMFRVPSWNCAPTQALPIVRQDGDARVLEASRWGWRRPFTKTGLINARADHVFTSSTMFRKAMAERRCVVPATHFYEWQPGEGKTKQPFAIGVKASRIFAMAGLWEDERGDTQTERCHVVCTIEPNELMKSIHDRQPLILTTPADVSTWLNPASTMEQVTGLVRTMSPELMHAWKVGQAVGNVRNQGPELAAPI